MVAAMTTPLAQKCSRGLLLCLLAGTVAFSTAMPTARAEGPGGDFGLGLIIGSPTGVSGKFYFDEQTAIDFAVGAALVGGSGVHAHADFLWHPWVLVRESSFNLGVFLGVGARVLSHNRNNRGDDIHIGARGPIGIVFDFNKGGVPLDAFVEVAAVLDIITSTDGNDEDTVGFTLNGGIGARYYF